MGENSGRIALVTGSSRGIGAATARVLARQGMRVVVNYRQSEDAARAVVESITAAGGTAMAVAADVREPDPVRTMVRRVEDAWGPVEVFVNNANMPFARKPFEQMAWEEFHDKLQAELKSAFVGVQAVVPAMKSLGRGRIVLVSSGLGSHPAPGFVAHGTAKGAINTFALYLARELGPFGITVNVVAPGLTLTDATRGQPSAFHEAIRSRTPLGRIGQPEDVAEAIALLVSEGAQFVTGANVPVDGGGHLG